VGRLLESMRRLLESMRRFGSRGVGSAKVRFSVLLYVCVLGAVRWSSIEPGMGWQGS
jgi:hypothetical protein